MKKSMCASNGGSQVEAGMGVNSVITMILITDHAMKFDLPVPQPIHSTL